MKKKRKKNDKYKGLGQFIKNALSYADKGHRDALNALQTIAGKDKKVRKALQSSLKKKEQDQGNTRYTKTNYDHLERKWPLRK